MINESEFEVYRNTFIDFYTIVKKGHDTSEYQHRGHGFDHDITVAMLAVAISPDSKSAALSYCAALLHSLDRVLVGIYSEEIKEVSEKRVRAHMNTYLQYLPKGMFTELEKDEIKEAAMRHSELNQLDQSLTQQILMDADRLSNLMLPVVIRAGQFRSTTPVFDFSFFGKQNPNSTYANPLSILDNLRLNISEYSPQFRIKKAKDLSRLYVKELEYFIDTLERSYIDLGLRNITL